MERKKPSARRVAEDAPWYALAFGRDYLDRYAHRSEAAARREALFLAQALNLPPGACVLDLCCGRGRHSRALARLGFRVFGVDLSRELLAHARAPNAGAAGQAKFPKGCVAPLFLRGDSRALPLRDGACDAVVNLFTSFGYFATEDEDLAMLREAARILRRGGGFVLDFLNLAPTLKGLATRTERRIGDARLIEERRYDSRSGRLEKRIRLWPARQGGVPREFLESVRAYTPAELSRLLRRAGFIVEQRFGGLDGAPFQKEASPRCVCFARKGRG